MSRRLARRALNIIEEPVVNLTPLIDVVFVILIMFIVVAPMLELDRVELADGAHDPLETSLAVQENSPVSIHVRSDNKILFNNRIVTTGELTEMLKKARKQHPSARPQLFHDKRGQFGTYQAVKNAAESAGYKQMDVVLKPS